MRMMIQKILTISALTITFACGGGNKPPTPIPTPPPSPLVAFDIVACQAMENGGCPFPIPTAIVHVQQPDGTYDSHSVNADGYVLLSTTLPVTRVVVDAPNFQEGALEGFEASKCNNGCHNFVVLTPNLPPPPTRDQILSATFTFQGLTVTQNCISPSQLGWFDVALFTQQLVGCREAIFAQKKAANDHVSQIEFFQNARSIYDESGQPYQQLTTFDYEHNPSQFADDVYSAITHGFYVWVYLDGDGNGDNYKVAYRQIPIVLSALMSSRYGDLTPYVVFRPGWDGVFYGWGSTDAETRQLISGFASNIRAICPKCYIALEFNTGHIPLGNGVNDYVNGGDMQGFDALDVEFNDSNIHDNNTWQILGRLLGPAYIRPPDQVGDPSPPWYLATPTPRGVWYVNCFEWAEYEWVRGLTTSSNIETQRQYFRSVGCSNVF